MDIPRVLAALFRRLARPRPPLPFLSMAERYGLTFPQIEEAVPLDEIHQAVARCNDCDARHQCGMATLDCINAPLFRRARGFERRLP